MTAFPQARRVIARSGLAVALAALAGCFVPPAQNVPAWLGLSQPELTSFLGVRFGESLARVEREHPGGAIDTSPYGADLYRIENVQADSAGYESVDYEFTKNLGMQAAIATFSHTASGDVLRSMEAALGAPGVLRPRSAAGPDTLEASWEMPHGAKAMFLGPARKVVMLGPAGSSLRNDIALQASARLRP
ncbi:MAG TPA: hypothetical protein VEC38_10400 [Candidatus Binataceae bacterium]|nr:hypothetical protein [Candidatus Binataceae bacterium]